jgi:hypothetical protein
LGQLLPVQAAPGLRSSTDWGGAVPISVSQATADDGDAFAVARTLDVLLTCRRFVSASYHVARVAALFARVCLLLPTALCGVVFVAAATAGFGDGRSLNYPPITVGGVILLVALAAAAPAAVSVWVGRRATDYTCFSSNRATMRRPKSGSVNSVANSKSLSRVGGAATGASGSPASGSRLLTNRSVTLHAAAALFPLLVIVVLAVESAHFVGTTPTVDAVSVFMPPPIAPVRPVVLSAPSLTLSGTSAGDEPDLEEVLTGPIEDTSGLPIVDVFSHAAPFCFLALTVDTALALLGAISAAARSIGIPGRFPISVAVCVAVAMASVAWMPHLGRWLLGRTLNEAHPLINASAVAVALLLSACAHLVAWAAESKHM